MKKLMSDLCRSEVHSLAFICGEGDFCRVCGYICFAESEYETIIMAHIRNLPQNDTFFDLKIESSAGCLLLPPLLSCHGNALMSVCVLCPPPHLLRGGTVIVATSGQTIACGRILLMPIFPA